MPHKIIEIENYVQEICKAASLRDPMVKPLGTQYPGYGCKLHVLQLHQNFKRKSIVWLFDTI